MPDLQFCTRGKTIDKPYSLHTSLILLYSKTPLFRPPFVPSKSGLNTGVVLIVNLADVKLSNLKTLDEHV